jgi:hypothetical protein
MAITTGYKATDKNMHKLMQRDGPIDVADFAEIPNITQQLLNNLHQKYIDNRTNH